MTALPESRAENSRFPRRDARVPIRVSRCGGRGPRGDEASASGGSPRLRTPALPGTGRRAVCRGLGSGILRHLLLGGLLSEAQGTQAHQLVGLLLPELPLAVHDVGLAPLGLGKLLLGAEASL